MNNLKIKEKRKELGLTQQDLADLIGVSKNTIVNYEKGLKIPDSKIPILDKVLFKNYSIGNQENTNIVSEPTTQYFSNEYDKKINQIKRLIAERTENLKYLPNDHPERNYNLEIIQILEERILFIEIAKNQEK